MNESEIAELIAHAFPTVDAAIWLRSLMLETQKFCLCNLGQNYVFAARYLPQHGQQETILEMPPPAPSTAGRCGQLVAAFATRIALLPGSCLAFAIAAPGDRSLRDAPAGESAFGLTVSMMTLDQRTLEMFSNVMLGSDGKPVFGTIQRSIELSASHHELAFQFVFHYLTKLGEASRCS